jgi:hypothetical protein
LLYFRRNRFHSLLFVSAGSRCRISTTLIAGKYHVLRPNRQSGWIE